MTRKKGQGGNITGKLREVREFVRELDNFASEIAGRSISGTIRKVTGMPEKSQGDLQEDSCGVLGVSYTVNYEQLCVVFDRLRRIYDLDGDCPNAKKMNQVRHAFDAICEDMRRLR